MVNKFISKSGKEYNLDKSKMLTDKKSFIGKCIHTFKCMFNKDCESLAKNELSMMSNTELELLGRSYNLELDKRKKKSSLVNQLYEYM